MSHFIFYISDFSGGGAESVIVRISNEMILRDNSVTIIVDRASGAVLSLVHPKIKIIELPATSFLGKILFISNFLRTQNFERFYTTLNKPNFLGFLSSCIVGKRNKHFGRIAAVHSMSMKHTKSYKRKLLLCVLSLTYRWFGNIVSVSEEVSLDLIENYKVHKNRIEKIYNPIKPIAHIKSENQIKVPKNLYSILVIGRLVEQKNINKIIEVFSQFEKYYQNVELNILGDGPELENLKILANKYGLTEKIKFRGYITNPDFYFQNSDLFILFSSWEGLPNVVLDALNFNLQIIVSDAPGGSKELVDYGRFGYITPNGDVSALLATMHQAKNNPINVCRTEKSSFLKQFHIDHITSMYEGRNFDNK